MRALIIDDEPLCIEALKWELNTYCPEVKIEEECLSGAQGILTIKKHKPDLVFLDIEMPGMNGFDMLANLAPEDRNFVLIFTTAYDEFALRAIKANTFDYLLKPVRTDELVSAVQRASREIINLKNTSQNKLNDAILPVSDKVAFSSMDEIEIVDRNDIVFCMSDSNYTEVHLTDSGKIVVSKTLKELEEILGGAPFLRVHQSYVINTQQLRKYIRSSQSVKMLNNAEIPVSKSRKEDLMEIIRKMA